MNILIFGHSFTHRLNTYLHNTSLGQGPSFFPIHKHNITCIGKGGAYLSGHKFNCLMHDVHLHLSTIKTHAIIISLGSNDIDSGASPIKVAQQLYALAKSLQATYKVKYVFIEQIINRHPATFPNFQPRATRANQLIKQLVQQGDNSSVRYWYHLNFSNPAHNLLCKDGVHLNPAGMVKYWRSLRGAILFAGRH